MGRILVRTRIKVWLLGGDLRRRAMVTRDEDVQSPSQVLIKVRLSVSIVTRKIITRMSV